MTTCQTLNSTVSRLNALQETVTNMSSFLSQLTDNANDLTTFASTNRPQDDLVSEPVGLTCRKLTGGNAVDMNSILPGGRDFTVCQPGNQWATTASTFSTFLPQGATWADASADKTCTPFPANGLFHGSALLCAETLPSAMALAVDVRTIRDRCLASQTTTTVIGPEPPMCTVNSVLPPNTWCDTVKSQAACDTTALSNTMMCKWKDNKCLASSKAGAELYSTMCAGMNPPVTKMLSRPAVPTK